MRSSLRSEKSPALASKPVVTGKAKGTPKRMRQTGHPGAGKAKTSRIGKKLTKALESFKRNKVVMKISKGAFNLRFATTRLLDRHQGRAPPWLARTMTGFRTYTLLSLGAFSLSRVKKDTAFLTRYFAGSSIFSYGVLPSAIVVGLNPLVSVVIDVLVTPISFGVMVVRERYLRHKAGQRISLGATAKLMFSKYKIFAKERHRTGVAAAYKESRVSL